jgi:hypothetical protein
MFKKNNKRFTLLTMLVLGTSLTSAYGCTNSNNLERSDYNSYEEYYKALTPTETSLFITEDNGDGSCTIIGYTGEVTDVIIPSSINGLSVSSIGSSAFNGIATKGNVMKVKLTSVIVPNTVSSIQENAFMGNNLTNVELPDSLNEIGVYAFRDNKLSEITLPKNLTIIGYWAFQGNNVKTVSASKISQEEIEGHKVFLDQPALVTYY